MSKLTSEKYMRRLVSSPIKLYQWVRPSLTSACCRFHPSCSDYTLLAIETHGVLKGLWLGFRRLLRCHPWSHGGDDPVLPN